ncbi:MAG: enoyl-CoA hydratase-related protein, partial [Thermoplasmata archaeon]
MIQVQYDEHVMVVLINRPEKRNAIDFKTANEIQDAFEKFEKDNSLYVAVISGIGGNFSAGADLTDLKELEKRAMDPNGPLGFTRRTVKKPVIAAISGYCVAGGFELVLWADIRIADETSKFGFLERRFGVPLIDGGTQRLPLIAGLG